MIPIITIEGATATGKSALAIELAQQLNTEIISADSRQVYRFMDIGTAKVSKQEQAQVTHHLIDIIDPQESYNAGRFCADAHDRIWEMATRGKLPIVCGGTGLYIRSMLNGLCSLPEIDPEIRMRLVKRVNEEGLATLYEELAKIDPEAAKKISSNDPQRTLRALEVFHATGIPLSEHWGRQPKTQSYKAYRIYMSLPREQLYARIEARMATMLEQGLVEEIKMLLDMGYTEADPGLKCLGYKEYIPYVHNTCILEKAQLLASQHQRNLAKRQLTWYRKCSFDLTLDACSINISMVMNTIKDFLTEADNADNR